MKRCREGVVAILLCGLLFAFAGCSASTAPEIGPPGYIHPDLSQHAILINEEGLPCDPVHFKPYSLLEKPETYQDKLESMFNEMDRFFAARKTNGPRRILIFVHGGMNTPAGGRETASYALHDMQKEGTDFYPFFLNWNSGPFSSLAEHLTNPVFSDVTDGQPDYFVSPAFNLGADLGRGITRSPIVLARLAENDVDALASALSTNLHDTTRVWNDQQLKNTLAFYYVLNQRYRDAQDGSAIKISVGDADIGDGEWARRISLYTAGLPARLATSPLLDALGHGAYEKMLRRARGMFSQPDAALAAGRTVDQISKSLDEGQLGAIPQFMVALQKHMTDHADAAMPYEITFVAHSLGTVVVNRIVGEYPDLACAHIVYLGAACTIDDLRTSVIPFLREHKETDFYNLSLHPAAEALDDEATALVAHGSLLVWIDRFLDEPQTPLNRTLGQWSNILASTYIFPREVRGRVTLKAFPLVEPKDITRDTPQVHSAFTRMRFWDETLWKAAAARTEQDGLIERARTTVRAN